MPKDNSIFTEIFTKFVASLDDDERDALYEGLAIENPDLVDGMDTALSGVNYDVEIKIAARWKNPANEAEQFFRDHIRLQNIEDEKLIEADVRDYLAKRDVEVLESEGFDDDSEAQQETPQAVH